MSGFRILDCGLRILLRHFCMLPLCFLLIAHSSKLIGQTPKGQFLQDSIKIGKPFQYALSYRHNAALDVIFPDTSYNFKPFEIKTRQYFPTATDERGSLDSVVYTLVSFDVHKVQALSLPIFIHTPKDCTAVFSNADSVLLKEMVSGKTDSVALKTDNKIYYLPQEPNYPLFLLGFLGFWVIFGLVYWLLGDTIAKQWQRYLLWRRHTDFNNTFQKYERNVARQQKGVENVQNALLLWRNFLERLEKKPFTTFTTRELVEELQDERLSDALNTIDATVYGGNIAPNISEALKVLKELATRMYRNKAP
jgi:hypothetical protein